MNHISTLESKVVEQGTPCNEHHRPPEHEVITPNDVIQFDEREQLALSRVTLRIMKNTSARKSLFTDSNV